MSNFPNFRLTAFFKFFFAAPFGRFFAIRCAKPHLPTMDTPCLLLFNHATYLDPLFLHLFPKLPVAFLTNREYFRFPWLAFLLNRVGCIPKTKGQADPACIRTALKIRQSGGAHIGVAITEGRNWDGKTDQLMEGTEKLVKKLQLPVVAVVLRGAYLSMPRWCLKRHRGPIYIEYHPIITPSECDILSLEAIRHRILAPYRMDDYQWQQQMHLPYRGDRRAERIERLLFLCPGCHSLESIRSEGNIFFCQTCQRRSIVSEEGFFAGEGNHPAFPFQSPPEWNAWQRSELRHMLQSNAFAHGDENATLWVFSPPSEGTGKAPLPLSGAITFASGHLCFLTKSREGSRRAAQPEAKTKINSQIESKGREEEESQAETATVLRAAPQHIHGVTNQYHDCLEFYLGQQLNRIKLNSPHASPYLWYCLIKLGKEPRPDLPFPTPKAD